MNVLYPISDGLSYHELSHIYIRYIVSRDAPDFSFANLAGAGPGPIHELKSGRSQIWELWTANAVCSCIRSDQTTL